MFYVSIRATGNYVFEKIRAAWVTGNATNYKNSQGDNPTCSTRQSRRQLGGASGARPPIWNRSPHFTFGPPAAAYIQCCILKMWPDWPPFCFLPLHLVFVPPAAKSWRRACNQRFRSPPGQFHHDPSQPCKVYISPTSDLRSAWSKK